MKAIYRKAAAARFSRKDICYCLRSKIYSRARVNRLLSKFELSDAKSLG
jgi:hypothetical protein